MALPSSFRGGCVLRALLLLGTGSDKIFQQARERGCRAGIRTQVGACIGCARHTSLLLASGFRPALAHHL